MNRIVLVNAATGRVVQQFEVPPNFQYDVVMMRAGLTWGPTGPEPVLLLTISPNDPGQPMPVEALQ